MAARSPGKSGNQNSATGRFVKGNNANPLGLNQYGGRKDSLIQVGIDTREMGQQARELINAGELLTEVFLKANENLAEQLQARIAKRLKDSVEAHGRAQRPKSQTNRLATAITSKKNRRVTLDGYTVGYLDDIAAVRPYWRGLEVGSYRHVGRFLPGSFENAAGKFVRPVEGGKDPRYVQFRTRRGIQPLSNDRGRGTPAVRNAPSLGVRIKNPIVGYHYFDRGIRDWIADGGTIAIARNFYAAALDGPRTSGLADAMAAGTTSVGRKRSKGLKTQPATPTPAPY